MSIQISKYTLSPKQFSDKIGVSPSTVRRWEEEGVISSIRTEAGYRKYSESDLADAIRHKNLQVQQKMERGKKQVIYSTEAIKHNRPEIDSLVGHFRFGYIAFVLLSAALMAYGVVSSGMHSLLQAQIKSAFDKSPIAQKYVKPATNVLAIESKRLAALMQSNVPWEFNRNVEIATLNVRGLSIFEDDLEAPGQNLNLADGRITASNMIYSLAAGDGIIIVGGQTPTISSSVKTFSTIKVGSTDIVADAIGDSFTIKGSGSITLSSTGSEITITGTDTVYTAGNDLELSGTKFNLEPILDTVTTINGLTELNLAGAFTYADGNQSAGYILTSDAAGLATWTDVSSTAGPWTLVGTNLYPDGTTYNTALGATDAGTAKLYVNGKVGIGTTNPSVALTVIGAITSSGAITGNSLTDTITTLAGTAWTSTAGVGWDLVNNSTTALNIETGLFNIDTQNRMVGIGTTAPTDTLEVAGTAKITSTLNLSSLTASRLLYTDASSNAAVVSDLTSWIAGTSNQITSTSDGDGTITLSLPQNIHSGASPTFTGLTLSGLLTQTGLGNNTFAGNVGIGTTNPLFKLDVNGTLGVGSTATFSSLISAANIGAGTDNTVVIQDASGYFRTAEIDSQVWGSKDLVEGTGAANQISYWSNSTTQTGNNDFWFDGTNVGIGTTNPSVALTVIGAITSSGAITGNSLTDTITTLAGTAWTSTAGVGWDLVNNSTTALNIETGLFNIDTQNRMVGIGTTAPTDALHVSGNIFTTAGIHIGADSTDNLIDDSSNGAGSTTLYIGNESILASGDIGVSVQGYDSDLATIASLTEADSTFIVGTGSGWTTETGATLRTSIGVGTGDSPTFAGLTLSGLSTAGLVTNTAGGILATTTGTDGYAPYWSSNSLSTTSGIYQTAAGVVGIGGTAPATAPNLYVGANGNVGIGTTNPGAYRLNVNGNTNITGNVNVTGDIDSATGTFAGLLTASNGLTLSTGALNLTSTSGGVNLTLSSSTTAFNVNAGLFNIDTTNSRVGIGTTAPSTGILHVVGQCVTGDTKLRRKRRRRRADGTEEEYWEDIRIDQIQEGDEIQTLDETTGKFVTSKVNGLMDMGIQQTYLLITETGKQIRTTGNHPYLTVNIPKAHRLSGRVLEVDQSNRIEDFTKDTYISVATTIKGKDAGAVLKLSKQAKRKLFADYQSKRQSVTHLKRFAPIVFGRAIAILLSSQNIKPTGLIIDIEYPGYDGLITSVINEQHKGIDIHFAKITRRSPAHWEAYNSHLGKRKADVVCVENEKDRDSISSRNCSVVTLMSFNQIRNTRGQFTNSVYKNNLDMSRDTKWKKVYELGAGAVIATVDGWEKIIALKKFAKEQTYDIEVENTHNFVGNGIVAHNTYLNGNLGIGNTAPGSSLVVGNNAFTVTSAGVVTATSFTDGTATLTGGSLSGITGYSQSSGNFGISGAGTFGTGTGAISLNGETTIASGKNLTLTSGIITQTGAGNNSFAGNVGIGLTNPAVALEIGGSGNLRIGGLTASMGVYTDANKQLTSTAPTTGSLGYWQRNSTYVSPATITDYIGIGTTAPIGPLQVNNGATPAFVVTSSGNIGIGSTSPSAKLTINGTTEQMRLSYDASNYQAFTVGSTGDLFIAQDGGAATLALTNGSVGIGTTSPAAKLEVAGTSWLRGATGTTGLFVDGSGNVGIGLTNPAVALEIGGSGNLRIGGLTASMGVYTDANKQLTSTPPTSGILGYWSRTGTTLSPSTAGDDIVLPTGDWLGLSSSTARLVFNDTTRDNLTITDGDLLFSADNTWDIGASGATRPRTGYFGTSLVVGSTITISTADINFSGNSTLTLGGDLKVGTNALYVSGTSGNVGVGTTGPITGKLHVLGECIVKGSKVRRRRKTRRRRGYGGQDDDPETDPADLNGAGDWEDVPVEDIQSGDEVLSLNEETGKFEWQEVEKTMDKGIQTVYELKTETGKAIETTANHPYYVRDDANTTPSFAFVDEVGIFDSGVYAHIGIGTLIFQKNEIEINQKLRNILLEAVAKLNQNEVTFEFKFKYITPNSLPFYHKLLDAMEKYAKDWEFLSMLEKREEGRFWTQYLSLIERLILPLQGKLIVLADHLNKPVKSDQSLGDFNGQGSIVKTLQLESQGTMLLQIADVLLGATTYKGTDMYKKEIAKRVGIILTTQQKRAGVDPIYAAPRSSIPKNNSLSNAGTWKPVSEIKEGQYIATVDGTSNVLRFEKVVSIKKTGRKQTYDLQIANTHNFVAQEIVAHNTYLQGTGTTTGFSLRTADSTGADRFVVLDNGNVGIGTTNPESYRLNVNGNTNITGTLNVTSTVTGGAYNGLTLTSAADGYTITGGTTPRTLTVTGSNITLTGGGNTLTLAGALTTANAFTTAGNYALTLTQTGTTNVTLPTTGTLATLAGVESLSNKTLVSPVITTSPTAAGATWTDLGTVTTADINGGTIDGTTIGGSSSAGATFTTLTSVGTANINATGTAATNIGNPTGVLTLASGGASGWTNTSGDLTLRTATSGNILLNSIGNVGIGGTAPSTSPYMFVESTGNVGVGTTNPGSYRLNVNGNTNITGTLNTTGAVTGGTYNGNTITTGTGTLTLGAGKTLTVSDTTTLNTNSITFGGGEVITFSASNALSLLTTGATSVTLPTSGTLYGTATDSISSAQLLASLSDETGSGLSVFNASPTITNPVIANIAPGADFTLTQNSVIPFTSVNSGAVANTLYLKAGNVGIGTTSPTSMLSVGASSQFQVDSSGNIVKLNNVTTSFPSVQGSAGSLLTNDGAGTLTWGSPSGTGTLGYWQRNSTFVSPATITDYIGIGTTAPVGPLQVNNGATPAFVVTSAGNIGIGSTSPSAKLTINGTTEQMRLSYDASNYQAFTVGSTGDLFIAQDGGAATLALTNGSVGIGTTAPGAKLHVYGSGQITSHVESSDNNAYLSISGASTKDSGLSLQEGNSGRWILYNKGSDDSFRIYKYASTAGDVLTINSTGNVGIGTTGPQKKLHIVGGSAGTSTNLLRIGTNGDTVGTEATITFVSDEDVTPSTMAQIVAKRTATGADLIFDTWGKADAMVIDTSGNVGIGTTNPTEKLHLSGNNADGVFIRVVNNGATGTYPEFVMGQAGSTGFGVANWVNSAVFEAQSSGGLSFGAYAGDVKFYANTGRTTNVIIKSGGNVGIGTTGPTSKLHILTSGSSAMKFDRSGANTFGYEIGSTTFGLYDYTNSQYKWKTSGGNVLLVETSGNVGIGTTNPGTKLEVYGTDASEAAGPHMQVRTSADTYPLFHQLNWAHDDIALNFDAYYNTAWKSSDAGSNFQIRKYQDKLQFNYESGIAAGSTVTWDPGIILQNNGNVGIGTTGPGQKLHVENSSGNVTILGQAANNSNSLLDLTEVSGGATFYGGRLKYTGASNFFQIGTVANDVETMAITIPRGSGNVGIGTTAPGAKLQVGLAGSNAIRISSATAGISSLEFLNTSFSASARSIQMGTDGKIKFTSSAGADQVTIDNSGNVGIGTTEPGQKLDIAGNINILPTGGTSNYLITGRGDTLDFQNGISGRPSNAEFYAKDGDGTDNVGFNIWGVGTPSNVTNGEVLEIAYRAATTEYLFYSQKLGTGTARPIRFAAGTDAAQLVLATSGNVGIGTTAPLGRLHLKGAGTTTGFTFRTQDSAGTDRFVVQDNGNVGIGTTAPSTKLHVVGDSTYAASFMSGRVGIGTVTPPNQLTVTGSWTDTANPQVVITGVDNETSVSALQIVDENANLYFDVKSIAGSSVGQIYMAGNVGIGTTGPGAKLHIYDASGTNNLLKIEKIGSDGYIQINSSGYLQGYLGGVNKWEIDPWGKATFAQGGIAIGHANLNMIYSGSELLFKDAVGYEFRDAVGAGNPLLKITSSGNVGIGGTAATTAPVLYVQSTGNVGIGTTTPSTDKLVIYDSVAASGRQLGLNNPGSGFSQINFMDAGTTKWRLRKDTSNEFDLYSDTLGASALHIKDNGNVGIGTTAPGAKLHTYVSSDVLRNLMQSGASDWLLFQTSSTSDSAIMWPSDESLRFGTTTSTAAAGFDEKVRITNAGNVGIGTTNPSYILDVQHASSKINSKNGYLTNGADYAEYFSTKDIDLEYGEVVCIDTINSNSVARCKNASDINVMGIVSTNPAFLGNASFDKEGNPKYKAIAMLGQIPAKVSNENGAIQIGDSLTSASIPGYIMKANAGDSTVGVALEAFGNTGSPIGVGDDKGTIQVMISRKNKSLTVESVEAKVTERIAAMKIEDEVNRLVNSAVQSLTPLNALTLDEFGSISTSTGSTGYNLSSMQTRLTDLELLLNPTPQVLGTEIGLELADTYPTLDTTLEPGDLVTINYGSASEIPSLVEKSQTDTRNDLVGIVTTYSTNTLGSGSSIGGYCTNVISTGIDSYLEKYREKLEGEGETEANVSDKLISERAKATGCLAARHVQVSLAGRAPVKVSAANGPIQPGDYLTASSIPGVAVKSTGAGMVVGRALEAYEGSEVSKIMAVVNLSWYPGSEGSVLGTNTSVMDISELELSGDLIVTGTTNLYDVAIVGDLDIGIIKVDGIEGDISTVTGPLQLQGNEFAGNIEAFGGTLVMTPEGNIVADGIVSARRFAGTAESRGAADVTGATVRVERNWDVAPETVNLTPSYETTVWVTDIDTTGFTINVSDVDIKEEVLWWAVW